MEFEGALIKEQGVTFAIVIVKPHITQSSQNTAETIREFSSAFSGAPVVLMSQDHKGIPLYVGRKDLVNFLANISISRIPWKKYTLN